MMNYWSYRNGYYEGIGWHGIFGFLIPLVILDLILRGISLWKSAKKDQNVWFIALLVVNSMGFLPLIYLLINRGKHSKKTNKK